MNVQEKIEWMKEWASKNDVHLELEGECGFGRPCVGILASNNNYPDYQWYDDDYERIDNNGDMFVPSDAYHKHPCVAVLGTEGESIEQLYNWLKWFDDNGFGVEVVSRPVNPNPLLAQLDSFMGKNFHARMVRKQK